jgi:hypothetical protein
VFVLDRSGSMALDWPGNTTGTPIIKAEFLSEVFNKVIREIGACSLGSGGIKHRCDIALIGYDGGRAYSLWGGGLAGRDVVGIPDIISNPLGELTTTVSIPDPEQGMVQKEKKLKYWIEPDHGGSTPMGAALKMARETVERWLQDPKHQDSFPPVIIHITDGVPDSGQESTALAEAKAIQQLSTSDGNALVITIHIPDGTAERSLFPATEADLPSNDAPARLLFDMASRLPDELYEQALGAGLMVRPGCKLMIMNADAQAVTCLVNWGSSVGGAKGDVRASEARAA